MFKISVRLFYSSVLILSCSQLVTGCLTTGSSVRPEAALSSAPPTPSSAYNKTSSMTAESWRGSWDQFQNRSGSGGRDSILGLGSDYRDLEAALWTPNDGQGTSMLSALRSSSRGGNSFRAPTDSWGGGGRFRATDLSLGSTVTSSSRGSAGVSQ
jgi:hypothetical protein